MGGRWRWRFAEGRGAGGGEEELRVLPFKTGFPQCFHNQKSHSSAAAFHISQHFLFLFLSIRKLFPAYELPKWKRQIPFGDESLAA